MKTTRPRNSMHRRVARLAGIAFVASAAGATGARADPCDDAKDALRARAKPMCTPAQSLSPAEIVTCAEYARLATIVEDCHVVAVRDDRRWLDRFPNDATHRKAEATELALVLVKLRAPNVRLAELLAKRRALDTEAEFYKGKSLPRELQREIDASDASLQALRDVFRGLEAEVTDIVRRYARERDHLRQLWGGASPGSIGPFVPVPQSSDASPSNASKT